MKHLRSIYQICSKEKSLHRIEDEEMKRVARIKKLRQWRMKVKRLLLKTKKMIIEDNISKEVARLIILVITLVGMKVKEDKALGVIDDYITIKNAHLITTGTISADKIRANRLQINNIEKDW